MKNRILSIFIIVIMTFAIVSVTPFTSNAEEVYATPTGYNDNDYQKLVAFFTQNDNNKKIIDNLEWDLNDPTTWSYHISEYKRVAYDDGRGNWDTYELMDIKWSKERVNEIWIGSMGFSGKFDLSDFNELTRLSFSLNDVTDINLSGCLNLKILNLSGNLLTSLDLSDNINLIDLSFYENRLSDIDLSNLMNLENLQCGGNDELINLDISNNIKLFHLDCNYSKFQTVDTSNNIALKILQCGDSGITSLDVSHLTSLTSLYCSANQLTALDLSNNTALEELNLNWNQLSDLSFIKDLNNLYRVDIINNFLDLEDPNIIASIEKIQAAIDINGGEFNYMPQERMISKIVVETTKNNKSTIIATFKVKDVNTDSNSSAGLSKINIDISEDVTKAKPFLGKNTADIKVVLDDAALLKRIENSKVKTVQINITGGSNNNIKSLIIGKSVINKASELSKNIDVYILNNKGKQISKMTITADGKKKNSDLDAIVTVGYAAKNTAIANAIKSSKNSNGIALNLGSETPKLTSKQINISSYLNKTSGIGKNQTVYIYKQNNKTGKLSYISSLKISQSGVITFKNGGNGTYVLLSNKI